MKSTTRYMVIVVAVVAVVGGVSLHLKTMEISTTVKHDRSEKLQNLAAAKLARDVWEGKLDFDQEPLVTYSEPQLSAIYNELDKIFDMALTKTLMSDEILAKSEKIKKMYGRYVKSKLDMDISDMLGVDINQK